MKKVFILFIIASILLLPAFAKDEPSAILNRLDYTHSQTPSKKIFTIPNEWDLVYNNYNKIQLEAGYDLSHYKGKECIMYTYEIYNHPFGACNANIIMYKDEIIGGDISSVNISGFMTPLI